MPHTRGSSHGQTRGIRKAYYEYFYAEMMSDAYEQWNILEQESDTKLLKYVMNYNFIIITKCMFNSWINE